MDKILGQALKKERKMRGVSIADITMVLEVGVAALSKNKLIVILC